MTERREELREEFSSEDVVRVPEDEAGGGEVRPEDEDGGDQVRPEDDSQPEISAESGEVAQDSEAEVPSSGDEGGATALLADEDAGGFRSRWNEIQVRFVDEPRGSVQKADGLVAEMMERLTQMFSEERTRLESQWERGDDVSTEDLRIALQRYRSFFERLLSA
jgi:hypothetical protein